MPATRPRAEIPNPPADLSLPARNAWRRLYELSARRGTWNDLYLLDLRLLAHACGWYVEAAEALRRTAPGAPVHPEARSALEAGRRLARGYLVDWGWLGPDERLSGNVDGAGFDGDLIALCAPHDQGRRAADPQRPAGIGPSSP